MLHFARTLVGRWPRATAAVLTLLVLSGAFAGLYAYALHQWELARRAVAEQRPAEGRDALALCLRVWPRSVAVHLLAARAARLQGDFDVAERHLQRGLELNPEARDAVQVEYLLMRVQTGELDEVEEPLLTCVENGHPESPLILRTLAWAYMRNLRYAAALNTLNRWIELEPDAALAHENRGWVLDRANQPQGAIDAYTRAVEFAPDRIEARLRLAEILLQEKRPGDADEHLAWLYQRHPDNPKVLARLGQCRFLQGRPAEAREYLEAAEPNLPDDPLLLVHLARLDLNDRKLERAEGWIRHLLDLDAADAEGQYTLIKILRKQGREKEADAAEANYLETQELLKRINILLRDEVGKYPTDPALPSEVGRGLLHIGQDRLGLHWLHEALKRDPRHQLTHQALAAYYEKKKESDKAAFHRRQLTGPTSPGEGKGKADR